MMIPHERSLVKRLEGQPFALIGVNTDGDRNEVKRRSKESEITWRSFWVGGTESPICRQWEVTGYPTIFVLDHKGIVRKMTHSSKEMEETVDQLLKEMNASKPQ